LDLPLNNSAENIPEMPVTQSFDAKTKLSLLASESPLVPSSVSETIKPISLTQRPSPKSPSRLTASRTPQSARNNAKANSFAQLPLATVSLNHSNNNNNGPKSSGSVIDQGFGTQVTSMNNNNMLKANAKSNNFMNNNNNTQANTSTDSDLATQSSLVKSSRSNSNSLLSSNQPSCAPSLNNSISASAFQSPLSSQSSQVIKDRYLKLRILYICPSSKLQYYKEKVRNQLIH
jgi:hypothetical protein